MYAFIVGVIFGFNSIVVGVVGCGSRFGGGDRGFSLATGSGSVISARAVVVMRNGVSVSIKISGFLFSTVGGK